MMKYYLASVTVLCLLFSCNKREYSKADIESGMQRYDHLIQRLDADSIALLYAPDGDLGTIAHGRDSIRRFLASFKNVRVLSNTSVSDSIEIKGDTAFQNGTYHQVAIIDAKDTADLKGTFHARWIWVNKEGWRIKKMETAPQK